MDGVNDMGGMQGFGAVVEAGSELVYHGSWEGRVFALTLLAGQLGLGSGPGGRARREEMDPADYLAASYYERWLWSTEQGLTAGGAIELGEVDRMMDRLEAGRDGPVRSDPAQRDMILSALHEVEPLRPVASARFRVGDAVHVRRMRPAGHTRCPRYVRGVTGRVERVQGADALPDLATYGLDAPDEAVYSVSFRSEDLWGPTEEGAWTVLLDLWESYLEAAQEA